MHFGWDPSWNRWKHLLSSKIEVEGAFVRSGKYKKRDGGWEFVDWETGLPSRLSVSIPADFEHDIERARNRYIRFGHYSRGLDQIRLCLEHKAIERKDLERMCAELGIPGDFDVAQISWRPDYDPFFYRELSFRAPTYVLRLHRASPSVRARTFSPARDRPRDAARKEGAIRRSLTTRLLWARSSISRAPG